MTHDKRQPPADYPREAYREGQYPIYHDEPEPVPEGVHWPVVRMLVCAVIAGLMFWAGFFWAIS